MSTTEPSSNDTIYNTGEKCPLAGCTPSGLMTNTYNIAYNGPHDRETEGVQGWKSATYHIDPLVGTKAWTKDYGENYWTNA
jgi:hypothetical protein